MSSKATRHNVGSIGDSDLTMEFREEIRNGKKSWDFKKHHKDPHKKQSKDTKFIAQNKFRYI